MHKHKHTDQHLDTLAKKMIKADPLKSPSVDFTATIMKQIEQVSIGETTLYTPLISKKGWFGIIAFLVGLSVYMIFGNVESLFAIEALDYTVLSNNKLVNALSEIKFSKTLTYAIGFFGLVFFIQIPLMKSVMNKRLEL
ncbi:MAG: hypothetical protein ACI849_000010 [Patiriisocius sp.]|jgi:hypothetical protein